MVSQSLKGRVPEDGFDESDLQRRMYVAHKKYCFRSPVEAAVSS